MALSDLTKQLAEQAIRSATSRPAPTPQPDNLGAALLAQVQAMQKALKEDEELVVLVHAGTETVRLLELFFPSWQLAVVTGAGSDKAITRLISPVESLQLVCRVAKVQPPAKPVRIAFVVPKSKPE